MARARLAADVRTVAADLSAHVAPRSPRSTPPPAPSCSRRWPGPPACRPSSTPSPATTGWRPRAAPAGRSPGGCTGCVPDRCGACASTGGTCGSPSPTSAPCSAAPRCRLRLPRPGRPWHWPRGGSPTVRGPSCRRRGPRRSNGLPRPRPRAGDALDQAVVGTSLARALPGVVAGRRRPAAAPVRGGAARPALAGGLRGRGLAAARLGRPRGAPARGAARAFLLLVGGLLLGVLLAALAAWLAGVGARRRAVMGPPAAQVHRRGGPTRRSSGRCAGSSSGTPRPARRCGTPPTSEPRLRAGHRCRPVPVSAGARAAGRQVLQWC